MRHGLRCALAAMAWGSAAVAVPIPGTGTRVPLAGTTVAQRPDLKGVVIVDEIVPYSAVEPKSGALLAGKVQNRVVRRSDGRLDFYWRVIPQASGSVGAFLVHMETFAAKTPALDIDFRKDGLGQDAPVNASWNSGTIELIFDTGCTGVTLCPAKPAGSRFFFARTSATTYAKTARFWLIAAPGLQTNFMTYGPATSPAPKFRPRSPLSR